MTLKLLPIAALGITLLSLSAEASREDFRQHRQRTRIREGVRSGELTRPEARHARQDQRKIQGLENRLENARASGNEKKADRLENKIEKVQDRASRRLYKNKHDDDSRPYSGAEHSPGDDHGGNSSNNSTPQSPVAPSTPGSATGQ